MHQPYYKDLADGVYTMPWVRLHCLKDYYGMVAVMRDFPSVHATFNLVPSLVLQIEDYARDTAHEPAYDLAFRPANHMNAAEREGLLASAFQINHDNLLNRYPRFRELWERSKKSGLATAAKSFTPQEILDLQVLSQVAWFDEIFLAGDPEVVRLVKKERGYSEGDKAIVRKKEIEIFNVTLEEYRKAAERGQIEISTSPFYHPILPLLCDTSIAQESHPGVKLPHRRFRHPEDARDQLRAALALHERVFGRRPRAVAERGQRIRRGSALGCRRGIHVGRNRRRRAGAHQADGFLSAQRWNPAGRRRIVSPACVFHRGQDYFAFLP